MIIFFFAKCFTLTSHSDKKPNVIGDDDSEQDDQKLQSALGLMSWFKPECPEQDLPRFGFKCVICHKTLATQDDLSVHVCNMNALRVNVPEAEFTCGLCSNKFVTQGDLRMHMYTCSEVSLNNDVIHRLAVMHQLFTVYREESFEFIQQWIRSSFQFRASLINSLVENFAEQVNLQLGPHLEHQTVHSLLAFDQTGESSSYKIDEDDNKSKLKLYQFLNLLVNYNLP